MQETKIIKVRPAARKKKLEWSEEIVRQEVLIPLYKGASMSKVCESLNLTRPAVVAQMKKYFNIGNKQEAIQFIIKENIEPRDGA